MAVFNIGSTLITSGAERHTAGVDPPDRVTAIKVQLVDTDVVWDTTVGNIVRWGIQASKSDGTYANDATDWNNQGGLFQDNIPFGSRFRGVAMPALRLGSTDAAGNPLPVAQPNIKLRLAIQTDTNIRLGATISTNTDAG